MANIATVFVTKVRETKGAVLYQEIDPSTRKELTHQDPESAVGTVYFRKHLFKGEIPTNLKFHVESVD